MTLRSASGHNPSLLTYENMKADVYYLLLRRLKLARRPVTVLLSVIQAKPPKGKKLLGTKNSVGN
jgi:hypothetical protein